MKRTDDGDMREEPGTKFPKGTEEWEEDLLEDLYEQFLQGRSLTLAELAAETGIHRKTLRAMIRRMIGRGWLELWSDEDGRELTLTDYGKIQGARCISRHKYLTEFLQMIVGMDERTAEKNACRMEHVLDEEGMQGIMDFLKNGSAHARVMRNLDLRILYETGTYECCGFLYLPGDGHPRMLADECEDFKDEMPLRVERDGSFFELHPQRGHELRPLWYLYDGQWARAEETPEGSRIPTRSFVFVFDAERIPLVNGTVTLTFTNPAEREPETADRRELSVHFWR